MLQIWIFLMFQNEVNFCGDCFMAEFLLGLRQVEGDGDGWGGDEGTVLTFWKIAHPVVSSVGASQVPAPFNSQFYSKELSLKKLL